MRIIPTIAFTAVLLFVHTTPAFAAATCTHGPMHRELVRQLTPEFGTSVTDIFDPLCPNKAVLHPKSPIKTWTQLDRVLHQEENLAWANGVFILYRDTFAAMEARSGVPAHLALAIMMTESLGGRELGTYPVIETLYNRFLFGTPKMRREALKQLRSFLRTKPWDACDCGGMYGMKGSSAGAFGYPQFIPRSYEYHGADGDGDGIVNLFSVPDAVASIASHLSENGWHRSQLRALRTYNNSTRYIEIVRGLAVDLATMPTAQPVQASVPAAMQP